MDAVAPALIGIGLYLTYVAWESHKNGTAPSPVSKITQAVQGTPAPVGSVSNPNPQAVATIPGSAFLP